MSTTTKKTATPRIAGASATTALSKFRKLLVGLTAGCVLFSVASAASAQEILLTGPLAGAPAVRKLRLYREMRLEVQPSMTFTLLDEYQRTMAPGLKLNFNLTDWLAIGAWGSYGVIQLQTGLTDEIQAVNAERRAEGIPVEQDPNSPDIPIDYRLTRMNLGEDFADQLGTVKWMASPQVTVVPFRGKLALFASIYVDTELYFFGGPGFVGLEERGACGGDADIGCNDVDSFERESRLAIAPTFGLGFTFFMAKFLGLGVEYRALPYSWNTGGFDIKGAGPNGDYPNIVVGEEARVNEDDRQFRFNQMLTVGISVFLPTRYRVSE